MKAKPKKTQKTTEKSPIIIRKSSEMFAIWKNIGIGVLISVMALTSFGNLLNLVKIYVNIPSLPVEHLEFAQILITTLFLILILGGYFLAVKIQFHSYVTGFFSGYGKRFLVTIFYLTMLFIAFSLTKNSFENIFNDNTEELEVKNILTDKSILFYDSRIQKIQDDILYKNNKIKVKDSLINKIANQRTLINGYAISGNLLKVQSKLKIEVKEYREEIKELRNRIPFIEKSKILQQEVLKTENEKAEVENKKNTDRNNLKSNTTAGFFELIIFFLELLSFVLKGQPIYQLRTKELELNTSEKEFIRDFILKIVEQEENENRKILKGHNSLINDIKTILPVALLSGKKEQNKEQQDTEDTSDDSYQEDNYEETEEEQEYKQEPIQRQQTVRTPPINGNSQRKILKRWIPQNAFDLPEMIELDRGNFEFEYNRNPNRLELERIDKLIKKGGKKLIFELQMQRFESNIYPNHAKPLVFDKNKPVILRTSNIYNKYSLNSSSPQKDNVRYLVADGHNIMKLFHHSNLILVQKEEIEAPRVLYEQV